MNDFLMYGSLILVILLALAFAKGSRGAGRQFALAMLTDIDSVADTIDRQVRLAGKLGLAAIGGVVAVLALFFLTPSGSGKLAQFIGSVISFAANLMLGLAAGIGINAALILAKVGERDTIEAQIEMKRRALRRLAKFVSLVVLAVLLGFGSSGPAVAAERAWVWAIDITDSMDRAQRKDAIAAMVRSAFERARKLRVDSIVVVKVCNEDLLSDMVWIAVPPVHTLEDCGNAPLPLEISKSWITFSPASLTEGKEEAVSTCLTRQKGERAEVTEEEKRFTEQLQQATWLVPRADVTTRIVPLLQTLVQRSYVAAVDVVTDLQDQSGTPPESLEIPGGTPVTIIVTRPNPRRITPTVRQVLAAAQRWTAVEGITVISASEYSGYVHMDAGR